MRAHTTYFALLLSSTALIGLGGCGGGGKKETVDQQQTNYAYGLEPTDAATLA
ncbi:MAG: hypothetical protein JST40_08200 [Armatimonadetes bacterium]|nr:hypothetical protein [Armatimonadota bacterium]